MVRVCIRFLAIVVLAGWLTAEVLAGEARPTCPSQWDRTYFFPADLLEPERPDLDAMVRDWYSKHLWSMSEPSLSCGTLTDSETYRFTWLRSFHHPIAVRVSHANGEAQLVAVRLSGAGGYDPGQVAQRIEKRLSQDQWDELVDSISNADIWALPTTASNTGFDGAQWIIEARRGEAYHLVDRWTPDPGSFRDAGLKFLDLAGWSVPEKEAY